MSFSGNISISAAAMRRILIAAKTKGKQNYNLSGIVTAILDAFWKPDELAKMCLSGNACPSIPGSVPKKKFPETMFDSIYGTKLLRTLFERR